MSDVPSVYRKHAGRSAVVLCVVALTVLVIALGLFASAGCREAARAAIVDGTCARFADLSDSAQPATSCRRELPGTCSTRPALCSTFVYTRDVNSSAPALGQIGTAYDCVDESCHQVGDACRCSNPAVGTRTSFCVRTLAVGSHANFACSA